jgi:hypothetical protein
MWFDLVGIMENIVLSNNSDQIIWSFNSSDKFSVQSLYAIINHRGVMPAYEHVVRKVLIPPRVQIFLWLLAKNKVLTRDNLAKRREVSNKTCLFCNELETVHHLFFDCCVAKRIWLILSEFLELSGSWNFEFIATKWVAEKKHRCINIVTSTALWSIWNYRNKLCF